MSDLHNFGRWRKRVLDQYNIKEFHYITDISNIYSIYNHEMIFSRNEANEKLDGKFKDWSNHSVQDLRDKEIIVSGGKKVNGHDVVPLFFNANNPTLHVKSVADQWRNLAIISIGTTVVFDPDVEIAFSNGNFARQDTPQHHDLSKLNNLDWNIIFGKNEEALLPKDPGYEQYKTKRSSEFFIYPSIKKQWIKKIYVSENSSLNRVNKILQSRAASASINKNIFS